MLLLTDKSLVALAIAAAILFPSVQYPVMMVAFRVYIAFVVILFVLDYIRIILNLKIEIFRFTEHQLSLLDKNPIVVEISYRGSIPLDIQLMESGLEKFLIEPSVLKTSIKPRTRISLTYNLTPITRGDFSFEAIHARFVSDMGFVIVQRRYAMKDSIRVVPSIKAITKYKLLSRHPLRTQGERVVKRVGRSTSFKELRDYIPGDEYRSIDWKSTARRNKLTVREYEDERCQNLMIMIDTGRHMTSFVPKGKSEGESLLESELSPENLPPWENPLRETTRLDFTVNASLVLSYVAISKGDNVGLMAFSTDQEIYLPPRGGRGQITKIVNTLYGLKPKLVESNYKNAFIKVAKSQRKRSLVIFFTDLVDPDASQALIKHVRILYPRHTVLLVAFKDAEIVSQAQKKPTENREIYDVAVAREILYNRQLALKELERGGVMTLDLYPEELSVNVVSEYIRMKANAVI